MNAVSVQRHSLLFTRSLWLSGLDFLMTRVHKRSHMLWYQNKNCQKPWKLSKKSILGGLRCFVWQLLKQPSWPWAGRQAAPHSETKRAFRTQLTHLWTLDAQLNTWHTCTNVQLHTCSQRVHKLYMLYIFVSERHIEKHLDVIVTEVHLVIITIVVAV